MREWLAIILNVIIGIVLAVTVVAYLVHGHPASLLAQNTAKNLEITAKEVEQLRSEERSNQKTLLTQISMLNASLHDEMDKLRKDLTPIKKPIRRPPVKKPSIKKTPSKRPSSDCSGVWYWQEGRNRNVESH